MTNIAVFGDSFAARGYIESTPTEDGFVKEIYKVCNRKYDKDEVEILKSNWGQRYKPWIDYLAADIYGKSGSDLYYSYNQFINNHEKYEKCIFVITSPYRVSANINGWVHCGSYEDAIEKIHFTNDPKMKSYFKGLADYFKNVYYLDLEKPKVINQAMLDSIKLLRPDTIFINSFPDLKNVYELELNAWNITHNESQDYKKYFDLRLCHMTTDNNKIFAKFLLDNLDKSGMLDLSTIEWKIPNTEDRLNHLPNIEDLFARLL